MPGSRIVPDLEIDVVGRDRASLRRSLGNRLVYSIGKDPITATTRDWFLTTANVVRKVRAEGTGPAEPLYLFPYFTGRGRRA